MVTVARRRFHLLRVEKLRARCSRGSVKDVPEQNEKDVMKLNSCVETNWKVSSGTRHAVRRVGSEGVCSF
jgi:hypothetical protein